MRREEERKRRGVKRIEEEKKRGVHNGTNE